MEQFTKEELIHAFRGNNTKRRNALYAYYKDWFHLPLTAEMLAKRITNDLGIQVGPSIIYHIRSKFKPKVFVSPLRQKERQTVVAKKEAEPAHLAIKELEDLSFNKPSIQFLHD